MKFEIEFLRGRTAPKSDEIIACDMPAVPAPGDSLELPDETCVTVHHVIHSTMGKPILLRCL